MKRSRKIPTASAGKLHLTVSDGDWQRIESAYENKLPSAVRKAVLEATQEFVAFEVFERTVVQAAKTKKLIEGYKNAAGKFQLALHAGGVWQAGVYAKHLVRKNFQDPRLRLDSSTPSSADESDLGASADEFDLESIESLLIQGLRRGPTPYPRRKGRSYAFKKKSCSRPHRHHLTSL